MVLSQNLTDRGGTMNSSNWQATRCTSKRLSKKDVKEINILIFVIPDSDPVSPNIVKEWRFCPKDSFGESSSE
ncbi:MAG: hypothetical protein U5K72_12830 [Balneolaceae bacterium]|nr:hypothetical protein [Balneolaceae bacterium]